MSRAVLRWALGIVLVLGLLVVVVPPTVLAAPQITVTPHQGPNKTLFVLTGVGFTPNTTYYLQILSADGKTQITFDDASTKSNGSGMVLGGFSFGSVVAAGNYLAILASAPQGGSIVASAPFTLTGPSGAPAKPDVVITPGQGKAGEPFLLTGTGFTPNTVYALRVQTENRAATVAFDNSDLSADQDGVILSGFTLLPNRQNGTYLVEVLSREATPAVVASTTFVLTGGAAASSTPAPTTSATPVASPMPPASATPASSPIPLPPPTGNAGALPGLPNTGAGGAHSQELSPGWLLVGLLTGLGLVLALRRRTA